MIRLRVWKKKPKCIPLSAYIYSSGKVALCIAILILREGPTHALPESKGVDWNIAGSEHCSTMGKYL
jgi:hypothetical protein